MSNNKKNNANAPLPNVPSGNNNQGNKGNKNNNRGNKGNNVPGVGVMMNINAEERRLAETNKVMEERNKEIGDLKVTQRRLLEEIKTLQEEIKSAEKGEGLEELRKRAEEIKKEFIKVKEEIHSKRGEVIGDIKTKRTGLREKIAEYKKTLKDLMKASRGRPAANAEGTGEAAEMAGGYSRQAWLGGSPQTAGRFDGYLTCPGSYDPRNYHDPKDWQWAGKRKRHRSSRRKSRTSRRKSGGRRRSVNRRRSAGKRRTSRRRSRTRSGGRRTSVRRSRSRRSRSRSGRRRR